MPKSKRPKLVTLSKVNKKRKEGSLKLFSNVRDSVDKYQYCFVFNVENMRNTHLKTLRSEFSSDSRFFFGKTKVMAKALGTVPEDEYQPNLAQLSKKLEGDVGLFFTNQPAPAVIEYFSTYSQVDYARAGTPATRDFTVPADTVYSRGGEIPVDQDVPLAHSLEQTVRTLGMPTSLVKGRVVLDRPYTVCKYGDTLNSHQTGLLKLFGLATAQFRVRLISYWSAATHEVRDVDATDEEKLSP